MIKNITFLLFILLVFVQWYVPGSMIVKHENVLKTGQAFKFKTQPIDPADPFRGRYVTLQYEADEFQIQNPQDWKREEEIFVLIGEDGEGFAQIEKVSKTPFEESPNYVKASINYVNTNSAPKLQIQYPFNVLYMGEFKAPKAETLHRESNRDSSQIAYGLVKVKNGAAILEDVFINDVSISELVE